MMRIIDKVEVPNVLAFVEDQLKDFDLRLVEWVKLLPLTGRNLWHGRCDYPVRVKKGSPKFRTGYRIRVSVTILEGMYPATAEIRTGTASFDLENGMTVWRYVYENDEFADVEELAVHGLGHEFFHMFRHSCQIEGQNTECQANRFGQFWLHEFREWR